jgi:hypothetical protein
VPSNSKKQRVNDKSITRSFHRQAKSGTDSFPQKRQTSISDPPQKRRTSTYDPSKSELMMDVLTTDRINPETKQPINLQLDAGDVSGKKGCVDTQKCLEVDCGHHQQVMNIIYMLEVNWHIKIAKETRGEDGEPREPKLVGLPPIGLADCESRLSRPPFLAG